MKLRAFAKLCSRDFFDDPSLLVVAWRRIMEVLEKEKKAGGDKNEKLEILDACFELGRACSFVSDFDDARRYYK